MPRLQSAVLLLSLICLAGTSFARVPVKDDVTSFTANQTISYWFACAKGALQGYEVGMYKKSNYVVNGTCLGPDTVTNSVEIYDLYFNNNGTKDIWQIIRVAQKIAHQQRAYCEFDDVMNDLFVWCDHNDCSINYMLQNILKKVIQITTVATNISNIINDGQVHPPITNTTYYATRYNGIATEAGKFVRYLTDFDATKLPSYQ